MRFSDHSGCRVEMYQRGSKKRSRKTSDNMIWYVIFKITCYQVENELEGSQSTLGRWVHWQGQPPRWEMLMVWAKTEAACLENGHGDTWVGSLPLSPCMALCGSWEGCPPRCLHTRRETPLQEDSSKRQQSSASGPKTLLPLLSYWLILAPGTWDNYQLWCLCCAGAEKLNKHQAYIHQAHHSSLPASLWLNSVFLSVCFSYSYFLLQNFFVLSSSCM